ncbi:MAG: class I SAM-dependent methyltransferase [Candidatus Obscuribacterales bacterium]|nr:class I SAM-dependent methyltransferase [Candidatus Obscuribacterales bacterium]
MRPLVSEFVESCALSLPISEPIYEFGAFIVEGQEDIGDLRKFFPGKAFIGADMREGPGVDIVLDLHDIKLAPSSAGTVICMDTLEHVEYPWKAIDEIHRILNSNGVLIVSSVMNFPIHDYPSDYWRFTPEAFKSLLKPFASSYVEFAGADTFPHSIVAVAFKSPQPPQVFDKLKLRLKDWKEKWSDSANTPISRIDDLENLVRDLQSHIKHVENERDLFKARWSKISSTPPVSWFLELRQSITAGNKR